MRPKENLSTDLPGGGGLVTKSCLTRATPWTVACQAPLSMGFSRQEDWSGLPFPSPTVWAKKTSQNYQDNLVKIYVLYQKEGRMNYARSVKYSFIALSARFGICIFMFQKTCKTIFTDTRTTS